MAKDFQQLAFDTYLAEYRAAREEYVTIIRQREYLLVLSLLITGALFSFYIAAPAQMAPALPRNYRVLSLYLVVPLCALTGARWVEQGWRARWIDVYIGEVLAVQMRALLNAAAPPGTFMGPPALFGGGRNTYLDFIKRSTLKTLHGMIHRFVSYGCFLAPGVLAQLLILDCLTGRFVDRLFQVPLPVFYFGNWVLLLASICLPIAQLLRLIGRHGLPE